MIKNGKNFNCQTCDKEFYRAIWQLKKYGEEKQKFCSLGCRRHTNEAKEKNRIAHIGKVAWNRGLKGTHFSPNTEFKKGHIISEERRKQLSKAWFGENHPNWKGGITPLVMQIRNSPEMKQWRKTIFERDEYTCQICFGVGGQLHADHILPFAYFPEKRFDLKNGRTLCVECHKKTDTYLSRAKKYQNTETTDGSTYFGTSSLNYTA